MAWRSGGWPVFLFAASLAPALADDSEAMLRGLIGKNQASVERLVGPPDSSESNGVQTFLHYRAFDARRTGSSPDPFGYAQGYSGALGFRGTAAFDCQTTLVFTDGALRAYTRSGSGCR